LAEPDGWPINFIAAANWLCLSNYIYQGLGSTHPARTSSERRRAAESSCYNMADPLSSLASVVTLAGSAAESIKVILKVFCQTRNAPAEVHQWLKMLESLHSTLSSLQQYDRGLDSRYRFSSHFRQRLLSCVTQLQICRDEVARADAELVKASSNEMKKWDSKARRSWQRVKWAIIGDQKMKKSVQIMNLYQFEFVMELLMVLL
jgi:hypothetical protein